MKAEIIAVGTELLLGQIVDTNSAYIAQQLTTVGLDLHFKCTVGDNLERIKGTMQTASKPVGFCHHHGWNRADPGRPDAGGGGRSSGTAPGLPATPFRTNQRLLHPPGARGEPKQPQTGFYPRRRHSHRESGGNGPRVHRRARREGYLSSFPAFRMRCGISWNTAFSRISEKVGHPGDYRFPGPQALRHRGEYGG